MPRRVRRKRTGGVPWRGALALALSHGPDPLAKPGDQNYFAADELREAWAVHGARILRDSRPDRRPWGFWAFDPSVPDDLRGDRPRLHRTGADASKTQAAREALEAARAAWLGQTNPTPEA